MDKEIWKPIEGFDGYLINNLGIAKSLERVVTYSNLRIHIHKETILKPLMSRRGYLRVTLFKDGKRHKKMLHRLVAEAFIPNPENKATVNHKYGDKSDNRASELEWATHSEQNIHAFKKLGRKTTSGIGVGVCQFDLNGKLICSHQSYINASISADVCKTSIIDCVNGRAKTAGGFIWK